MKKILFIIQIFVVAFTGFSGPLVEDYVSKDAKWLVHLDMEDLLSSQFGEFVVTQGQAALDKEMDSPVSVNIDRLLREMHSVTAYGTSFDDKVSDHSVIVIKTGDKAQAIIDGYIASLESEGESPVELLSGKRFPSYVIDEDLYFAFPEKDVLVVSKSYEEIELTAQLIDGKRESIAESDMFVTMDRGDGFFLVSVLHRIADMKDFPPQARVLQKAKGAAFYAGEIGEDVEARIVLSTESNTVSEQLYRIVLGMLALVSFAEFENQSLSMLTENADVQRGDDFVSIYLRYPSQDIIYLLEKAFGAISDH